MKKIELLIIIIVLSSTLKAQETNQTDSTAVSKVIYNFFSWYINSIKDQKLLDFQPEFIESREGNTTLNLDTYIKNLKRHEFSDTLITNEVSSYKDCINNLATIKFSDFRKEVFVDLDEYEQFKCDFSNYYRWIGGQEICDGVTIKEMKFTSENKCQVYLNKYTLTGCKEYFWWSNIIKVTCIETNRSWKINSIEIK